jgi:hypothetical protein
MARRAGVTVPFSLSSQDTPQFGALSNPHSRRNSPSRGHAHSQSHGSIPASHFPRMPMLAPLSMQGQPPPFPPHLPPGPGGRPLGVAGAGQTPTPPFHTPRESLDYGRGYSIPGPGYPGPPVTDRPYSGSGPVTGSGPPPMTPIAPIQTAGPPGRAGGFLPSVAELTTGVSPYSTPAYSLGPLPGVSPDVSAGAGQGSGPGPTVPASSRYSYGPPDDPSTSKRRGSPSEGPREPTRRRHLDPPYDNTS